MRLIQIRVSLFPWVRVLWPFLTSRICCLRGNLVLGKGTKLRSPAGKDQKVTGTSPFPPPPTGSSSLLGRLTSLNHSISSSNNKKSAQSGRTIIITVHSCLSLGVHLDHMYHFFFSYFIHYSSTTQEPSLVLFCFFWVLEKTPALQLPGNQGSLQRHSAVMLCQWWSH